MSGTRSTTCTLSPHKSSSASFNPTAASSTSCSSRSNRDTLKLTNNQILVKFSHVNDVFKDFKTQVYDDEEQEECHFLRIVRIGPEVQNKESTVPGALIVVHRTKGIYLEDLSEGYGELYYLLNESDIMTYIDL